VRSRTVALHEKACGTGRPAGVVFRGHRVRPPVESRLVEGDRLGTHGKKHLVRNEVVMMIVPNEHQFVRRTCGSVRSSLSAPARLVTVGSEAAETKSPRRPRRGNLREEASSTTSVKLVGETGWMKRPTKVNCHRHRHLNEPKTLTGSDQNGTQSGAPSQVMGHTDKTDCRGIGRG